MSDYNDAESAINGGQALPCDHRPNWMHAGMTLRDYFAAHASEYDIKRHMPTGKIIENVVLNGGTRHIFKEAEMLTSEQARFKYADAMLKVRG